MGSVAKGTEVSIQPLCRGFLESSQDTEELVFA